MPTDVYLEIGAKKTFACSVEWPGWCRSGRDEAAALEHLADYAPRYAPIAARAGARFPTNAGAHLRVVESWPGSATTEFGAIDKPCAADDRRLTKAVADRLADIVEASWSYFDEVVAGAPAELRKGPRGGGRDRDKIVDHVLDAEIAYARKLNLKLRAAPRDDAEAVTAQRAAIVDAIRAARAPRPDPDKGWPYRYAARRIAWHVLDHAWEIEDRIPS